MSSQSAARRYAAALFDVTHRAGSAEQAGSSLAQLAEIVASHPELNRVLTSPAVPVAVKSKIVAAVIAAGGGANAEVGRMISMLAERDRLGELTDLAAAFSERLMDAQKILRADVTTAVPLTDASRQALTAALGRATGKSVTITERVDPAIVGGVIARVGSFVYDASITRQIERLRDRLTASH